MKRLAITAALLFGMTALGARAAEPGSCRNVRFADVGWTDITATTALASTLLEGLGYQPKTTIASVPITLPASRRSRSMFFSATGRRR